MPSQQPHAEPVSLAERIQFIDVLRGMALFGILTANMRAFTGPIDAYGTIGVLFPGHADVVAQGVVDTIFQGKFISIFSFLFGLGFAMQLSRAEARGTRFLSFYPRRLLVLAAFGLIHGLLIWAGDILLTYALAGAMLLLFRKRAQKTLLYWAGGLFALPAVMSTIFLGIFFSPWRPAWMKPKPPEIAKWHGVINTYAHGHLRQIMWQNLVEWKQQLPGELFALYAVAIFLCGMWVWREGIVQRLDDYKPLFRRICAGCLLIGLPVNLYVAVVTAVIPPGTVSIAKWFAGVLWLPGAHTLAVGYMSGLALLYLTPGWRRVLHPFAAVGRMALTNYLMQSLVCTWFFYSTGTGLYGRVGPAMDFLPVVLLYSAQLVASNLWLRHYRFGPMEWLWRGLTYGHFPTLRTSAGPTPAQLPQGIGP